MSSSATTNDKKKAALIFLHGLGDTPAGWSSLEKALPQMNPKLSQLKYVFPAAPQTAITINGGMLMPGWFDLFNWPIGVGSVDDKEGKMKSMKKIEDIVEKLEKEDGIPKRKIVVGGFSQGGAIAILTAYHKESVSASAASSDEESFAGCASLSGWLTLPDEVASSTTTPLFWGHGKYDDKVLFEQQAFGVKKLQEKGVSVQHSDYSMGHESDPEEIKAFADFLEKVLFD